MGMQSGKSVSAPGRAARVAGAVLGLLMLAGCAGTPSQPTPARHVTVRSDATALLGPAYAWFALPASTAPEQDARVEDPAFRARLPSCSPLAAGSNRNPPNVWKITSCACALPERPSP